ncbi:MAG: ribbon-helix-helix domain-containing protein [Alphaproteobacteria bacterium]|jgi:predicted DNA-binding ribbon-helix-helix protein|nr:ribbon-helix-helix domain-containing protein [Alphaproteobacteria bacterium]
MCRIFASQDPASYAPVARALRLSGHTTSIRLEAAYWAILDEMAAREAMTTPRFIGKLYDEVLDWHGEVTNFTSMLRVTCTLYTRMQGDRPRPPVVAPQENRAVVT